MATAVLDLDVDRIPDRIPVGTAYERALVLYRWRGQPVGQARLPVVAGVVPRCAVLDASPTRTAVFYREHWLPLQVGRPVVEAVPPVTVAVCTRDRTDELARCLEALSRLPDDGHEILIVDNCPSSDATRDLVARHQRVRYVREPRPGLDVARNRALVEAHYEIVAFTDDDAAPDPGWLQGLARNFDDPLVLAVTGLTMPRELETRAQELFEEQSTFGRGFRRLVFDARTRNPLSTGAVGAGVNMALRRSVIEHVGAFDEALDAGTPTCSGGDHEMFSRILTAGYRIVYDPAALCWHTHRRTWPELRAALRGYGVGVYAAWTRALLVDREFGVLALAFGWFYHDQLPRLVRALLRRPGSLPLSLLLAELRGCLAGPGAYVRSRRAAQVPVA